MPRILSSFVSPAESLYRQPSLVHLTLGSKRWQLAAYTPHEALRHWPREGGSRATDVRVSRQSDLVRADDGTPVPYPLLWPCAAISRGCFAPGGFALSHERCVRRFTTAGQSRRARRAIYRQSLRRACRLASRPLSVDRPDDLWAPLVPPPVAPLPLATTDVPEMLELAAATEPGPFLPQTIQMGNYFGIRASDGRLAAMAGERLQSTGFAEISAVCTHPEFRGRGYARDLVTFLGARILAAGKTPFLHVKSENGAKAVYQKIGFRLRAPIWLTVISHP